MDADAPLMIFGASARAAAFSALRAGLQPWCADLFADADLRARCPTIRVPGRAYPDGFLRLVDGDLPGPWVYTGGLENRPTLVRKMARCRPLWGNGAAALARCRDPLTVATLLTDALLPCPEVRLERPDRQSQGRWLVKPISGAGGRGISFWDRTWPWDRAWPLRPSYYQMFVEGPSCAAVYLGDGRQARLLGATRQLVGEPWLHAAPFHYCGSVGPLRLTLPQHKLLERLGNTLASGCRLRGLFGVDFILREGLPWAVEVNPRYTASVEVLEYATGLPALALHRQVFDPAAPYPTAPGVRGEPWLGKAILFARRSFTFPETGPWLPVLRTPGPLWEAPAFADVPPAGQRIAAGRPVLTFFAGAGSEADCLARLRDIAADLDCRLSGE